MSDEQNCEVKQMEGCFVLRFNRFADLSTETGVLEDSPEFFGSKLVIGILPGGRDDSDDGMVAVQICNNSHQPLSIALSLSIRN